MAKGDAADDYTNAVKRLMELADEVAAERSQEEVLDAVAEVRVAIARAYRGRRTRSEGAGGARGRILAHLMRHLGDWVSSDELAAVSGIGEWARRIRELRFEQGYEIEEGGGRYRILAEAPNLARRDRWRTVTSSRNRDGAAVDRVQALLEALVGETLTLEELNRVAHGKDGAELARQIRNRELLPIESSADAPDLGPGDHRLASQRENDRLHPAERLFAEDLRRQVFTRDRFICQVCRIGRTASNVPPNVVFYLVVRHLDASPDDVADLSADRLTNLMRLATSCNRCITRGYGFDPGG
jgi:biotin operon repressor